MRLIPVMISTALLSISMMASAAGPEPTCGILTKESPGSALSIQYFFSYGTTPENFRKIELVAGKKIVAKELSAAYNNGYYCILGQLHDGKIAVTRIWAAKAGM
jgi:hypothetical protein